MNVSGYSPVLTICSLGNQNYYKAKTFGLSAQLAGWVLIETQINVKAMVVYSET